jgi:hypothetical protein
MSHVVTRLFDDYKRAEAAVLELESIGVSHTDISLIANEEAARRGAPQDPYVDAPTDAVTRKDATLGAEIGGVVGLLAGLAVLAIPGVGPVMAAGWLVSLITGAVVGAAAGGAIGGLVGGLMDAGVPQDDANVLAEGVRRGATLVSARVPDHLVAKAGEILDGAEGVSAEVRGAEYRAAGWVAFDPAV